MSQDNFEKGLKRLEEIAALMKENTGLEENLKLYKEAKELAEELEDRLDRAELTIKNLSKNSGYLNEEGEDDE